MKRENKVHIFDRLLIAQQSELDAALMYLALAKKAKVQKDADTFRQIAADKKKHSEVFRSMTNTELKPNRKRAILIWVLYKLLGRKGLYPVLAVAEYRAHQRYDELARRYNSVRLVWNEQKKHGDKIVKLLY
ncbi:MAG: rubrerythrin [Oscillospiraceae bacterium]|nr:rubrerythrin [Oscillospiraceae bacterium]